MSGTRRRADLRFHGRGPYSIAALHGGPGAAGEMRDVAETLSAAAGVLEPFQTAETIAGQIEELRAVLEEAAARPVVLIGFSWGAWLAFLYAGRHPRDVRKLILVSSAPFEDSCADGIDAVRRARLSDAELREIDGWSGVLHNDAAAERDKVRALARIGALLARADAYRLAPGTAASPIEASFRIYSRVWTEARELRRSRRLLALGREIVCPVTAIHGDHDPHPAEGVRAPLSQVVKDFRFVLLEKCGHRPWLEIEARAKFADLLREEAVGPRKAV